MAHCFLKMFNTEAGVCGELLLTYGIEISYYWR